MVIVLILQMCQTHLLHYVPGTINLTLTTINNKHVEAVDTNMAVSTLQYTKMRH